MSSNSHTPPRNAWRSLSYPLHIRAEYIPVMEQPELHPIACESCRNKKSKCDRELPVCSQCNASGSTCRYPQIHKRGIPSGYISFIEQRLLETELVVFELLTAIYQSHTPIDQFRSHESARQAVADFSGKQSKSAKVEEWKYFPLASDEQRQRWWQNRQEIIQHGVLSSATITPHSIIPQQPERGRINSSFDESAGTLNFDSRGSDHVNGSGQTQLQSSDPVLRETNPWQPLDSRENFTSIPQVEGSIDLLEPTNAPQRFSPYQTETGEVPSLPSNAHTHEEGATGPTINPRQPHEQTNPCLSLPWRKYF
ncbi:hypothetical protein K469DRAFT_707188 [Zopfia rhizophila CBS 207.26]|uniref:Zn(2)-C6 fungal-type domain-containing protein n=1 Tax=Zopfia rhizophila CBS 207.26 TaxID=1314779 RepID=A0A6A6E5G9_9PEZI|nr:hypothetical protein K469DRAFT_707188 [Zopfia rhizophila CBS 207.26]